MLSGESSSAESRVASLEAEVVRLQQEIGDIRTPGGLQQEIGDVRTPGGLLSRQPLSTVEKLLDDRIRTLALCICASAVVCAAIYYLRPILVPFFLAVALKYLLSPLIDLLSCTACRFSLPRGVAILLALLLSTSVLSFLALLVIRSVTTFSANASVYDERIDTIIDDVFEVAEGWGLKAEQIGMGFIHHNLTGTSSNSTHHHSDEMWRLARERCRLAARPANSDRPPA